MSASSFFQSPRGGFEAQLRELEHREWHDCVEKVRAFPNKDPAYQLWAARRMFWRRFYRPESMSVQEDHGEPRPRVGSTPIIYSRDEPWYFPGFENWPRREYPDGYAGPRWSGAAQSGQGGATSKRMPQRLITQTPDSEDSEKVAMRQQLEMLAEKLRLSQRSVEELRLEKANSQDETAKKQRLEQENQRLGQENQRLGQENQRLDQKSQRLEQELKDVKEGLGQDNQRLNQDNQQLNQDNQRLNQDNRRLGQENQRLEQDLRYSKGECQWLEEELRRKNMEY